MESETGEDLGWFWRGWFEQNWQLDLAVTGIDAGKHSVGIANNDKLVMPSTLKVDFTDGSSTSIRVPVETWQQHVTFDVLVPGDKPIRSATIDPDHKLPDRDRSNNVFPAR